MLLDGHRVSRELLGLGIGQRELHPLGFGHVDDACRLIGGSRVGEDHPRHLAADALAKNRRPPRGEVRLVHTEFIRVHAALHDRFAKTVRRRDQHDLIEARLGVQREHHARRTGIAAHHALDADRQRDVLMRKSVVHAIGDRAVVVNRREYFRNYF